MPVLDPSGRELRNTRSHTAYLKKNYKQTLELKTAMVKNKKTEGSLKFSRRRHG